MISSQFQVSQDTHCNDVEGDDTVAVAVSSAIPANCLRVSQGTQCNGFAESANDAEHGPAEPPVCLDAALLELQRLCEILQSPNFSQMSVPISSEWFSRPGCPAPGWRDSPTNARVRSCEDHGG